MQSSTDQRNLSWKGIDFVSLLTLNGRIKLKTRVGEYQRARALSGLRGQADLIYRNRVFYLIAVVEAPEASQYQAKETLGVDLGIHNLATDSDGEVFSGKQVEQTRQRYSKLKLPSKEPRQHRRIDLRRGSSRLFQAGNAASRGIRTT